MKVAICGGGPLAIEMSLFLDQLGASVRLFCRGELGGNVRMLNKYTPKMNLGDSFESLISECGLSLLEERKLNFTPTIKSYWENYLSPLIEIIKTKGLVKEAEVDRVHKRFLDSGEEILNRKRILDLFRVVYKHDPKDGLSHLANENSAIFEKLDKKFLESLEYSLEKFEDFDLVVDARGVLFNPSPAGPSGSYAINEKKLKGDERLFYGVKEFISQKEQISSHKNITLLGSGETAAYALYLLEDWMESSSENQILLVTQEAKTFSRFLETSKNEFLKNYIKDLLKRLELSHQEKTGQFQLDLKEWEKLELYIKAKVPRPKVPERNFSSMNGYNLTAIDSLTDNEKLFVTIESAPFRTEEEGHKTYGTDALLVATGYRLDKSFSEGLRTSFNFSGKQTESKIGIHPEPGFYTLTGENLSEGLNNIPLIGEDMLNFFSKKE